MNRYLYVLAVICVLLCSHTCTAQVVDTTKVVNAVRKCWRVISHEYSTIYGLEEEEIKSYSKQRVCFTADSVRMFQGAASYSPKYSVKKVNAENYAKNNFDTDKKKLGISVDSVYEVTISSLVNSAKNKTIVHKMTNVIAFDGDCIYVVVDGVIFRCFDANAEVRPRASN